MTRRTSRWRRGLSAILRFLRGLVVMLIGAAMIATAIGLFVLVIAMAIGAIKATGQSTIGLCVAALALGGLYVIRLGYDIMLG